MPATTQEQLLSYILPKVFIEKISLNSNDKNNLKVTINLTIKEILDNNLFGSWFDQINIKKYILIDVVQSTDPKVTDALSFSNDMIQICNFSRRTSSSSTGIKAFSYITKEKDYSKLISILRNKTQRQSFSISKDSNGDNKISNYSSYVDNDGKKIYEIPYKVTFTIDNMEPEHLSYFVVSSLDMESLSRDFKIDYDVLESLEENGRVLSEIVINNSQTVGLSFVYVDKNGSVWDGPVHQLPDGTWKTGDDETPSSIAVTKTAINNTKIEDFRNIKEIQKRIFDFTSLEKMFSNLNITKIESADYSFKKKAESVFSDLNISRKNDGNIGYVFSIDFYKVLKYNSSFSELFNSNNQRFKQDAVLNTRISSIKLWRSRIKNNIKIDSSKADIELEKFDNEQVDELIVMSSDVSWKNFRDKDTAKGSITELEIQSLQEYDNIRMFNGVDKNFSSITDGLYQYYIELEIEDGISKFIEQRLAGLENVKKILLSYYNEMSKPTMRKYVLNNSNPHTESPNVLSTSSTIVDYGYDPDTNKFSNQLVNKIYNKYKNKMPSAPWVVGSSLFVDVLDLFSESIKTTADRTYYINILYTFLSPRTGNPSSILKVIELYDYLLASVYKLTNINPVKFSNNFSPTSSISTKGTKTFKIIKYYNNVVDSNLSKSSGYDYLSTSNKNINTTTGLTVLTYEQFANRIQNENKKFFKTGQPNLSMNINGNNINFGSNAVNNSFSHITPTRIDFPDKSVMLSNIEIKDDSNKITESIFDNGNKTIKSRELQNRILQLNSFNSSRRPSLSKTYIDKSKNIKEDKKQEENMLNDFKELLTSFSNLTIEPIILKTNNTDRDGENKQISPGDLQPVNNFFSSISHDKLFKKEINLSKYTNSKKNNATKTPQNGFAKQLAEKDPVEIKQTGDTITGFKSAIKIDKFYNLPNQLKGLISKTKDLNENIKNGLDYTKFDKTVASNINNHFNFEMIMEVQYLYDYKKTFNGEILLNNPIWKTLTKDIVERTPDGKQFLCRLAPYENLSLDIKSNKNSFDNCYDQHFIISANKIKQPENTDTAKVKNLFIDKIINDIQIQVPNMILTGTTRIDKNRNIPQIIQISEIKSDKPIPESIPKVFRDDMKKVSNIKNINKTIPVSSNLLAQALSIDIQNKNVSNNIKNNNFIPPNNIKKSLNKDKGLKK